MKVCGQIQRFISVYGPYTFAHGQLISDKTSALKKIKVTIEGIGQTAPNTDESFSHLRTKRANPYNPYSRRKSSANRSPPKSREPQAAYSPRQYTRLGILGLGQSEDFSGQTLVSEPDQYHGRSGDPYTRQQPPANIDTSRFDPEATIITECKRIDQTDLGWFSNLIKASDWLMTMVIAHWPVEI